MRATAPRTSQQQSSVINNNRRVICNGNTTAEAAARERACAPQKSISCDRAAHTKQKGFPNLCVCVCDYCNRSFIMTATTHRDIHGKKHLPRHSITLRIWSTALDSKYWPYTDLKENFETLAFHPRAQNFFYVKKMFNTAGCIFLLPILQLQRSECLLFCSTIYKIKNLFI